MRKKMKRFKKNNNQEQNIIISTNRNNRIGHIQFQINVLLYDVETSEIYTKNCTDLFEKKDRK